MTSKKLNQELTLSLALVDKITANIELQNELKPGEMYAISFKFIFESDDQVKILNPQVFPVTFKGGDQQ